MSRTQTAALFGIAFRASLQSSSQAAKKPSSRQPAFSDPCACDSSCCSYSDASNTHVPAS